MPIERIRTDKCDSHSSRDVNSPIDSTISLAPMLDVTDSEFRQFMRLLSKMTVNWTEMVVENTILNCDELEGFLGHDEVEHPVVCQVGGSDIENVGKACEVIASWGYDEVNINCGCPSDRVATKGCFGAALMKEAELVERIYESMKKYSGSTPCTIKMRLGVDEFDNYEFAHNFVSKCVNAGCTHFIVHARKCWLRGLSPAKNRTVPPLRYDRIYRLARDFPNIKFSLNGGVGNLDDAEELLYGRWRPAGYANDSGIELVANDTLSSIYIWEPGAEEVIDELRNIRNQQRILEGKDAIQYPKLLEGIMIGRGAMNTIWMFADVDRRFYSCSSNPPTAKNRRCVLEAWRDILRQKHPEPFSGHGQGLKWVRPILGLFGGLPGNKLLRQFMEKKLRTEVTTQPLWEMIDELITALDEELKGLLDLPIFLENGQSGADLAHSLIRKKNEALKAAQQNIEVDVNIENQ